MSDREQIAKDLENKIPWAEKAEDWLIVADWHIAEIAKAKQEAMEEAIREILAKHKDYRAGCNCGFEKIINEGGK